MGAPQAGNLRRSMVHLTNYSLSKFSDNYVHSGSPTDAMQGCKRTLSAVLQRLEADPDASFSVDAIWEALCVLTRQTVDAISQQVMASQRASEGAQRCFHIVGLDVLL